MTPAKLKEIETRKRLGRRLKRSPRAEHRAVAPTAIPNMRLKGSGGSGHPTRDSGRS